MSRGTSVEAASWLRQRRADARARFDALGVPGPTDEDWRHTDVRPLGAFAATVAPAARLAREQVDALSPAPSIAWTMVLVNGRCDAAVSSLAGLPDGLRVVSLAAELAERAEALEDLLGRAAAYDDRAFVALNTALFEDGVLVDVAPGLIVSEPLHILHVAVPGAAPHAIHPRTLIRAGAGSRLDVVESFVTLGSGAYATIAVTEVVVAAGAHVEHVKIQAESASAWHVATVAGLQARDARFGSHNVSSGAALARNDIGSRLDGEGAACHLYGLYVADGAQHVDNHTWLDHAAPNCPSWEMYKGVMAGRARAVFNGRIVVRPDAQKTDAKQSNKNLLLSGSAVAHTRPQLEIYANDVKCTHGATIGRLDEASLFYLQTRGIGRREARDLLIHAFAEDVLAKIPIGAVREGIAAGLYERLARDLAASEVTA